MALISRIVLASTLCFVLINGLPGRNGRKGKGNRNRGSKKIANNKNGNGGGLVTCPGFAGYCSESYPGDTCLVVCAFGRNNVPVCQEDGTWTDEPRCIEHEPGKAEQVPGTCPGVPGYCSLDLPGGLCTFECARGAHIRSSCLPDGTWDPYPTCDGDVRETKDGCDPCPGPFGGPRNRTAEAGGGSRASSPSRGSPSSSRGSAPAAARGGGSSRKQASSGSRKTSGSRNSGGSRRNGASSRRNKSSRKQSGGKRKNGRNSNKGGPRRNSGSKRKQPASKRQGGGCPDSVLEACIDACPGANTQVFSRCVSGCSKRCTK